MSTQAAVAIAGALWKGFRKILIRIGRWLLRVFQRRGKERLVGYMICRIDVFRERLARARRKRRQKWLQGRIRRWTRAVEWIVKNSPKIMPKTLEAFDVLSKKIPDRSPWERAAA